MMWTHAFLGMNILQATPAPSNKACGDVSKQIVRYNNYPGIVLVYVLNA